MDNFQLSVDNSRRILQSTNSMSLLRVARGRRRQTGVTAGETGEIGYNPVADPVNVHDLRANVLHLAGIDNAVYIFKT